MNAIFLLGMCEKAKLLLLVVLLLSNTQTSLHSTNVALWYGKHSTTSADLHCAK